MSKIKSVQVRWDAEIHSTASSSLHDHIFMAFPMGWFAGLIAGTVYAGFHWNNLQVELGRIMLLAVTVALGVAYWLSCRAISRVFRNKN